MPYTLVHPVAALPVWAAVGRRLRLAAVAIGALTPDFQYFLHMNTVGGFMHTPVGLILACVPLGWLTLWLWDRYGQHGLAALLPPEWRSPNPVPHRYPVILTFTAILVGALTHVAWDSFTHASGAMVALFPVLRQVITIGPITYPVYKFLQHTSTLAGGGILALLALRWMQARPPVPWRDVLPRLALVILFLATVAFLNAARFWSQGIERVLVTGGVAVTLGAGLGPIGLGMVVRRSTRTAG